MSSIQLYNIPTVIFVLMGENGVPRMNYPVINTNIKIYNNVDNSVEVYIKDFDRKPVNLTGTTPVVRVVDRKSEKILLTRSLTIIDATKGAYKFYIGPSDSQNWPFGDLEYSIVVTDGQGKQTLIYMERDFSPFGQLTFCEGPLVLPIEPVTINKSSFLFRNGRWYSGPFPGAAAVGNTSGVHTALFYIQSLTGSLTIQASLDSQPGSSDSNWFDVVNNDIFDEDTPVDFSFTGNYLWVRFVTTEIIGSVTKVVFKN